MKRILSLLFAAALLSAVSPAASAAGEEAALSLSCPSAVLMEKETGAILYDQNAHQQLEPASVTKVMTLLLVMEAVDSGRGVRADQHQPADPLLPRGHRPEDRLHRRGAVLHVRHRRAGRDGAHRRGDEGPHHQPAL